MPGVDELVLIELFATALVMRDRVVGSAHAIEEGEVAVAYGVAKHEGGHAGGV